MTMARINAEVPPAAADGSFEVDGRRYLRPPVRIHFPDSALVPESKRHLKLRTLLHQILDLAFADRAAIGCDQFVYWDPTDPAQCLAPDAFVRLGRPDDLFKSWKVWERGAPEVAVEIASESESGGDWDEKRRKYARLGVQELVRFDPESDPPSLRIWDAVDGDLVERVVSDNASPSRYLPGSWIVVWDEALGPLLRLKREADGGLYLTPAEQAARARDEAARARDEVARARDEVARAHDEVARARDEAARARDEAVRARDEEAAARAVAEARVRELEAELRRRR
jgi:hypothetical protein